MISQTTKNSSRFLFTRLVESGFTIHVSCLLTVPVSVDVRNVQYASPYHGLDTDGQAGRETDRLMNVMWSMRVLVTDSETVDWVEGYAVHTRIDIQ